MKTKEYTLRAIKAYNERLRKKGLKLRNFWLTIEEWEKVKEFIRKMREENAKN